MDRSRVMGCIAGLLLASAATSASAAACKCPPKSAAAAAGGMPLVYDGHVTSVRTDGDTLYATVEVVMPVKGAVPRVMEIATPASAAACGFDFRQGEFLRVGTSFREQQYRTDRCAMAPLNPARK